MKQLLGISLSVAAVWAGAISGPSRAEWNRNLLINRPVASRMRRRMAPGKGKDAGVRTPATCIYPLEVLIVQDLTDSFSDDLQSMVAVEVKKTYDAVEALHPKSSFSVMSHRDKPISPYGIPETDYCQKMEQSSFTTDFNTLLATYQGLYSTGGGDFEENQFGALFYAMQGNDVGFGLNPNAEQLIIFSTDAVPHFAGDGKENSSDVVFAPFSGSYNNANPNSQCMTEYYPSPKQATAVTYSSPVGVTSGIPWVGFLIYDENEPTPNFTLNAYKWFAAEIGEDPDAFVQARASDSSNFAEVISRVIYEMDKQICNITTTTPAPSTTTTPTTTPTTTTTTTTTPTTTTTTPEPTTTTTTPEPTTTTTTTPEPTTTTTTTPEPTTTTTTTPEPTTTTTTTPEPTTTTVPETTSKRPCPHPCPHPCPEPCDGRDIEVLIHEGDREIDTFKLKATW